MQNILPTEINYVLRLIVVQVLLVWAWRWYVPVKGSKSLAGSFVYGVGFGLAGLVLWCVLYAPFTQPDPVCIFYRSLGTVVIIKCYNLESGNGHFLKAMDDQFVFQKRLVYYMLYTYSNRRGKC